MVRVFVRHRAVWVKVSLNRLVKSEEEFVSSSQEIHNPIVQDNELVPIERTNDAPEGGKASDESEDDTNDEK